METINWRREGLFLAAAGMETCWIVGWSRLLLQRPSADASGLSWWSILALYLLALGTARALNPPARPSRFWSISALAVLTSLLLVQINLHPEAGWLNLGWIFKVTRQLSNPATSREIVAFLLGLLTWFRALRIPAHTQNSRAMVRQFQIGVLVLAGLILLMQRFPVPVTELMVAYFALGVVAMALTRIEEVAESESRGAAPFNLKWLTILGVTLLIVGIMAWTATQLVTVDLLRLALRPFVILWSLFITVILIPVILFIQYAVLPLIQRLFGEQQARQLGESLQEWFQTLEGLSGHRPPSATEPDLLRALQSVLIIGLILMALWLTLRSFRRWRMHRYAVGEGQREDIEAEKSLVRELADFVRHLGQTADPRRLLRRWNTQSAQAIYGNLLTLLADADRARQPEQTPYEYEPLAQETLSRHRTQVRAITEAYVQAHYGEAEISPKELARLREAWQQIQSDPARISRQQERKE